MEKQTTFAANLVPRYCARLFGKSRGKRRRLEMRCQRQGLALPVHRPGTNTAAWRCALVVMPASQMWKYGERLRSVPAVLWTLCELLWSSRCLPDMLFAAGISFWGSHSHSQALFTSSGCSLLQPWRGNSDSYCSPARLMALSISGWRDNSRDKAMCGTSHGLGLLLRCSVCWKELPGPAKR